MQTCHFMYFYKPTNLDTHFNKESSFVKVNVVMLISKPVYSASHFCLEDIYRDIYMLFKEVGLLIGKSM